jgi:hypothetical protein
VVEPIKRALRERGLGDAADSALNQPLGGNRGDMKAVELVRRQQFAAQIAAPIALGMLHAYEEYDPAVPCEVVTRKFGDFFHRDNQPTDELLAYVNSEFAKRGAKEFRLQDMEFSIDLPEIDRTVRSAFLEMLPALGEAVHRQRCDLLILSGRPSRLPAVRGILEETCALPSHRMISLHQFRVGPWYPYRDQRHHATVGDPKTTAAVGAMLCLLGNGQLQNFNFRSDALRPRSTARFFGKLDHSSRLLKDDEFYDTLDLDDPNYELPEHPFDFRGPMPLGFRQLPVDWWPASRLYFIKYATPEDGQRLSSRTPLHVTLKRKGKPIVDKLTGEEYGNPELEIGRVADREGRTVPSHNLRLRLQTISNEQGYWLDTGILLGN